MTHSITLTRFDSKRNGYKWHDAYKACLDANAGTNCHSIQGYMDGLMKQMAIHAKEPTAWSFGEWQPTKATRCEGQFWLKSTAIVLEYRSSAEQVEALIERADALGYCHILTDSFNRRGKPTISIIFPLTESISEAQYARLASVLMEEIGLYSAESGNMAMTHLIHLNSNCQPVLINGAVLSPIHKIRDTRDLYKNISPTRFEAGGPMAVAQIVPPTITSHDGLFEGLGWPEMSADDVIERVNLQMGRYAKSADSTSHGELLDE